MADVTYWLAFLSRCVARQPLTRAVQRGHGRSRFSRAHRTTRENRGSSALPRTRARRHRRNAAMPEDHPPPVGLLRRPLRSHTPPPGVHARRAETGQARGRRLTPVLHLIENGSGFWVPGSRSGSPFLVRSRFPGGSTVPGSEFQVRRRLDWSDGDSTNPARGTRNPWTRNLERTRNLEPDLEPRTRNRNRTRFARERRPSISAALPYPSPSAAGRAAAGR